MESNEQLYDQISFRKSSDLTLQNTAQFDQTQRIDNHGDQNGQNRGNGISCKQMKQAVYQISCNSHYTGCDHRNQEGLFNLLSVMKRLMDGPGIQQTDDESKNNLFI